jgi:hypothetical protein
MSVKRVAAAFFAVLALGVAFASTASASEWHVTGGTLPEKIEGKGGAATLESTIAGVKVIITCSTEKGTGELLAAGAATGTLTYETCKLFEVNSTSHEKIALTKCVVANPVAEISGALGTNNTIVTLSPKVTNFTEIKITNATEQVCLQKGTFAVKGKVLAAGPEGEVVLATHLLVSDGEGSEAGGLLLGAEKARLTGTLEVKTVSGKTFWGE